MQVFTVPCLRDNYAYLIASPSGREALVVDPSEALPVVAALSEYGLTLKAILNTHHHPDHVGGNAELVRQFGPMPVYAHASDQGRIPEQNHFLEDGATFTELGFEFRVLYIPGHTLGAIAYVCEGCAFTGDTLFAAGCGRMFEGTAEMMDRSLNERLAELSNETLIYCGHEYTAKNLEFAQHVEPNNSEITREIERVAALRSQGKPSVPSNFGRERLTNPFLRCDSPAIIASLQKSQPGVLQGQPPVQQGQPPVQQGQPPVQQGQPGVQNRAAVFGLLRAAKDAF